MEQEPRATHPRPNATSPVGSTDLTADRLRPDVMSDGWLLAAKGATLALRAWFAASGAEKAAAYASYEIALVREARAAALLALRLAIRRGEAA